MNEQEFGKWSADLETRLPVVGQWMAANPATVDCWQRELFGDVELSDALAVNAELMRNWTDKDRWELDGLGGRVRTAARQLAWERDQAVRERQAGSQGPPRGRAGSLATALAATLKAPPAHRRATLDQLMPAASEDGPRARCRTCRDTGLVTVYDPDTVIAAWRKAMGQIDHYRIRTQQAACDCFAGERHALNQRRPLRRLDPRLYTCTEVTQAGRLLELAEIAKTWQPPARATQQQEMDF